MRTIHVNKNWAKIALRGQLMTKIMSRADHRGTGTAEVFFGLNCSSCGSIPRNLQYRPSPEVCTVCSTDSSFWRSLDWASDTTRKRREGAGSSVLDNKLPSRDSPPSHTPYKHSWEHDTLTATSPSPSTPTNTRDKQDYFTLVTDILNTVWRSFAKK